MKAGQKLISALASLAVLASLCVGIISVQAADATTISTNILDGTDTLSDLSKISGWGGDISFYQQEAANSGVLHLNWTSAGLGAFVNKTIFGDIQAPWISWNVKGGATVEFAGSIHDNFAPTSSSNFRFQWTADGDTWTSLTLGTDVQGTQISSENIATYNLSDESIAWFTMYYTMTMPANAIGVRVIYPEDMVDKSMAADNHWQVVYRMIRTSGGTERTYAVNKAITGSSLQDLSQSYVVDSANLQKDQTIGSYPALNMDYNSMPTTSGAAVTNKPYVVYEVKGGSPFAVEGALNDDGHKFNMEFRLSWSSNNTDWTALSALTSVSGASITDGVRKMTTVVSSLPTTARYVKVELPIDYNYTGMTYPGYKTATCGSMLNIGLALIGVYFDSYVAPPENYSKLESLQVFYNDASYASSPSLLTIADPSILLADIDFNSDTTSYDLTVPYAVEQLNIVAKAYNTAATVSGTGINALTVGENTVTVAVSEGNTYTFNITREAQLTASKTITADGSKDFLVDTYDYKSGFLDVTQKMNTRWAWNIVWDYINGKTTWDKPYITFAVNGGSSVFVDASTFDRALKLDLHFKFYVTSDNKTWTEVPATVILGEAYGSTSQMAISYSIKALPENAKLFKIEWPNDRDYTGVTMSDGVACDQMVHWAPSIHSVTLGWANPFQVTFEETSTNSSTTDNSNSNSNTTTTKSKTDTSSTANTNSPTTGYNTGLSMVLTCLVISSAVVVVSKKKKR